MADIKFACSHCGQVLEAPPDMAGETIECPACNRAIEIPAPEEAPRPRLRTAAAARAEEERTAAAEVDEEEDPSAAVAPGAVGRAASGSARKCPSCSAALPDDAVLCVACGYHLKRRRKLRAPGEKGSSAAAGGGAGGNPLAIIGLVALIVLALLFVVYRIVTA